MKHIRIDNLVKFFPYESVHASNALIKIEDKNGEWYSAISTLLNKYYPVRYVNCAVGYFHVKMDNKITLELTNGESNIYLTYWDNTIYISDRIHQVAFGSIKYCTVEIKEDV
jgi:hypothetical protein